MNLRDAAWVAGRFHEPRAATHSFVRVLTCPFDSVIAALPRSGPVLDIGCGHGVLGVLARRDRPGLSVTGVDIDRAKVGAARRAGEDVTWASEANVSDTIVQGSGDWSAITMVDVLYLLGWERTDELLKVSAAALAPGGVLVVKETGLTPRWKATLTRLQEQVATSPIGPTASTERPRPYPLERGAALLAETGLNCRVSAVDRGYHVPHRLLVGRRSVD